LGILICFSPANPSLRFVSDMAVNLSMSKNKFIQLWSELRFIACRSLLTLAISLITYHRIIQLCPEIIYVCRKRYR
jgi:hypothetical protein